MVSEVIYPTLLIIKSLISHKAHKEIMIQTNKLFVVLLITTVLSIGSMSILLNTVKAQEEQSFSATLSGKEEVPSTESNSTGTAKFQVTTNDDNESQVSYWVNITGIREVNGSSHS